MHIFHKYEPLTVTNYHFAPSSNMHMEPTHTTVVSKCQCGKIKSEDFHGVFTLEDLQR